MFTTVAWKPGETAGSGLFSHRPGKLEIHFVNSSSCCGRENKAVQMAEHGIRCQSPEPGSD